MKNLGDEESPFIATLHNNVALAYQALRDFDSAMNHFQIQIAIV